MSDLRSVMIVMNYEDIDRQYHFHEHARILACRSDHSGDYFSISVFSQEIVFLQGLDVMVRKWDRREIFGRQNKQI